MIARGTTAALSLVEWRDRRIIRAHRRHDDGSGGFDCDGPHGDFYGRWPCPEVTAALARATSWRNNLPRYRGDIWWEAACITVSGVGIMLRVLLLLAVPGSLVFAFAVTR